MQFGTTKIWTRPIQTLLALINVIKSICLNKSELSIIKGALCIIYRDIIAETKYIFNMLLQHNCLKRKRGVFFFLP